MRYDDFTEAQLDEAYAEGSVAYQEALASGRSRAQAFALGNAAAAATLGIDEDTATELMNEHAISQIEIELGI